MIEPNRIGTEEPAHPVHEVGVRRLHHEMEMIRHEAIGMDLKPRFLASLGQRLEEVVAIHIIQENVLAAISTAHHMIDRARILDPDFARHPASDARGPETVQPMLWFDPFMPEFVVRVARCMHVDASAVA